MSREEVQQPLDDEIKTVDLNEQSEPLDLEEASKWIPFLLDNKIITADLTNLLQIAELLQQAVKLKDNNKIKFFSALAIYALKKCDASLIANVISNSLIRTDGGRNCYSKFLNALLACLSDSADLGHEKSMLYILEVIKVVVEKCDARTLSEYGYEHIAVSFFEAIEKTKKAPAVQNAIHEEFFDLLSKLEISHAKTGFRNLVFRNFKQLAKPLFSYITKTESQLSFQEFSVRFESPTLLKLLIRETGLTRLIDNLSKKKYKIRLQKAGLKSMVDALIGTILNQDIERYFFVSRLIIERINENPDHLLEAEFTQYAVPVLFDALTRYGEVRFNLEDRCNLLEVLICIIKHSDFDSLKTILDKKTEENITVVEALFRRLNNSVSFQKSKEKTIVAIAVAIFEKMGSLNLPADLSTEIILILNNNEFLQKKKENVKNQLIFFLFLKLASHEKPTVIESIFSSLLKKFISAADLRKIEFFVKAIIDHGEITENIFPLTNFFVALKLLAKVNSGDKLNIILGLLKNIAQKYKGSVESLLLNFIKLINETADFPLNKRIVDGFFDFLSSVNGHDISISAKEAIFAIKAKVGQHLKSYVRTYSDGSSYSMLDALIDHQRSLFRSEITTTRQIRNNYLLELEGQSRFFELFRDDICALLKEMGYPELTNLTEKIIYERMGRIFEKKLGKENNGRQYLSNFLFSYNLSKISQRVSEDEGHTPEKIVCDITKYLGDCLNQYAIAEFISQGYRERFSMAIAIEREDQLIESDERKLDEQYDFVDGVVVGVVVDESIKPLNIKSEVLKTEENAVDKNKTPLYQEINLAISALKKQRFSRDKNDKVGILEEISSMLEDETLTIAAAKERLQKAKDKYKNFGSFLFGKSSTAELVEKFSLYLSEEEKKLQPIISVSKEPAIETVRIDRPAVSTMRATENTQLSALSNQNERVSAPTTSRASPVFIAGNTSALFNSSNNASISELVNDIRKMRKTLLDIAENVSCNSKKREIIEKLESLELLQKKICSKSQENVTDQFLNLQKYVREQEEKMRESKASVEASSPVVRSQVMAN